MSLQFVSKYRNSQECICPRNTVGVSIDLFCLYLLWFSCQAARSALDFSGDMFLKVSNIVSKSSRQQDLNFCLPHFKFLMTPLYHILALGTTDAIKFRLSCDSDETRHIVWGEFRFCHLYCGHSSFVIRQILHLTSYRQY